MTVDTKKMSGAETLRKTRTFGKVRCHNPSCMERMEPAPGADHIKCATCGMEFRIYWVRPDLPRIRGPVWEVNRKIAEEALAKKLQTPSRKSKQKKGA
jgi:LSD1 subclass zinc finger protein